MTDNGQGAKLKPVREGVDQMRAIARLTLADLGLHPPVHGFGDRPSLTQTWKCRAATAPRLAAGVPGYSPDRRRIGDLALTHIAVETVA